MPDPAKLHVLAISGSLRKASFNTALLRAAEALTPEEMTLTLAPNLSNFPLYNEEVYAQGFPPPVDALRKQIAQADALLIATPEYNYGIPGVLKNAIDWCSRPPSQPFAQKPLAIVSASPGWAGGARAQYQLRQMVVGMNMFVLNKPEVFVSAAAEKFDAAGTLHHEPTRKALEDLLIALGAWVTRLKVAPIDPNGTRA